MSGLRFRVGGRRHVLPAVERAEVAGAPATPSPAETPDKPPDWKVLLEIAAAATGMVALVGLVGRGVMWARFDALGLPAMRSASMQPADVVLGVGFGAVVVSLGVGACAVALLYALRAALPGEVQDRYAPWFAVGILEGALVVAVPTIPLTPATLWVGLAAGAVFLAAASSIHTMRRSAHVLFFVIALIGGAVALVRNHQQPVRLDAVLMHLKDGSLTSGALVAESDSVIAYAPDSFDETFRQLAVIPRSEVASLSVTRASFRSAGEAAGTPIFARARTRAKVDPTAGQIARYVAAWTGDPIWRFPPATFIESREALRSGSDEFFPTQPRAWKSDGASVISLLRLAREPRSYAGQVVTTRGFVLHELHGGRNTTGSGTYRYLVVGSATKPQEARAVCAVLVPSEAAYPSGTAVEVRGIVAAAGSLVNGASTVPGVFMQCSGVRDLAPPGASPAVLTSP